MLLFFFFLSSFPLDVSRWHEFLLPLVGNASILDLSLFPGTHDSLSVYNSASISDNANDLPPVIADVLHAFAPDGRLGPFVQNQSITQGLNITQQLDAGARFIDFRIVWTSPPFNDTPGSESWYSLHLVQTMDPAEVYLRMLRAWLDQHPSEFVALWFSRHGSPCGTQYPDTPLWAQKSFWALVEQYLGPLLLDRALGETLHRTPLQLLHERGHRVVVFLSAPNVTAFTSGSSRVWDGCSHLDNPLGNTIWDWPSMVKHWGAEGMQRRRNDSQHEIMYLQSMSSEPPVEQIMMEALLTLDPDSYFKGEIVNLCAQSFGIPGMGSWCPETLLDVSLLGNFYKQQTLEAVTKGGIDSYVFPHAIYLNGMDREGTIRTGTSLFGPHFSDEKSAEHGSTAYSYIWTVALFNIRWYCSFGNSSLCVSMENSVQTERSKFPLTLWNDPGKGRLINFPNP